MHRASKLSRNTVCSVQLSPIFFCFGIIGSKATCRFGRRLLIVSMCILARLSDVVSGMRRTPIGDDGDQKYLLVQ